MIRRAMVTTVIVLALGAGVLVSMPRSDGFPHEKHAGLFPTCLGCHAGIPEGDESRNFSVEPKDCIRCHDGTREETVDWDAPSPTVSNLAFVHAEHMASVAEEGDDELSCRTCHGPLEEDQPRMAVGRAAPETCVGCHAHEAPEHLASGVDCRTCHVPLVDATELAVAQVAEFPRPPGHESDAFVLEHGEAAAAESETCAVCHARESCTRCHLNAGQVDEIQALPPDTRVAQLVAGQPGEWPEPPTHEAQSWDFEHGKSAGEGSLSCASCHAEPSCRTCHGEANVQEIAALPEPSPSGPAGVTVTASRAPGHTVDFASEHATAAAANLPNCSSCHVESQCLACHDKPANTAQAQMPLPVGPPSSSGYHPQNFMMRHGAEAFAVQAVCTDCHSTEAFCRDCHQSLGMAVGVADGAGGAFHDAQPDWLFEHGRAARQGMESCASCHQQTSCLRCHSAKSGLRINPHGDDFDPERVRDRSVQSCATCHTADQILP